MLTATLSVCRFCSASVAEASLGHAGAVCFRPLLSRFRCAFSKRSLCAHLWSETQDDNLGLLKLWKTLMNTNLSLKFF